MFNRAFGASAAADAFNAAMRIPNILMNLFAGCVGGVHPGLRGAAARDQP
jgi:hypothetical protein